MSLPELWYDYHNTFGSWFPTMCFQTDTPEKWNDRIKLCLEKKKSAEELYGISYSEDIDY